VSNLFQVRYGKIIKRPEVSVQKTMLDKFGCCICCGAKWKGDIKCFHCKTIIDFQGALDENDCMDEDVDEFSEPFPNKINGKKVSPKTGWFTKNKDYRLNAE